MGMGLETYDEKGRLIITTNNIIPRFLGTHVIPLKKEGSLHLPGLTEGGNVTARFFLFMSNKLGVSTYKLSNEFTRFSASGSAFNYYVDYDEWRWENKGWGGGQGGGWDEMVNRVTIWAI
ncbi:hypothetical protein Xbed_03640 [Xenorhabdus beddingii]|uniref:Uncharacterized protein n=2 Tax=Xenorhabdus beddingii TaxID=40578 RepID=A0A1Y2SBC9_9GAMM|nr:hypothetical protein Xbed_03640 [Xenorhabdus beddingii]